MKFGKCLETRHRKSGLVYRRYRDDKYVTTTTFEVPTNILEKLLPAGVLRAAMDAWKETK